MLKITNLNSGYEHQFFLRDISFNIEDKDFIGIIGPNGSGKTTLLKSLTKALAPKSGNIIFEGKDITQMSFKELAQKVAVVGQSEPITFDISVEDFIALGRMPHQPRFQFFDSEEDKKIVYRAMELTDTLEFRQRLIKNLSGGERQLVIIAKALAQQPKLLLLDEPTVFLDITHQVKILDLIRRLNRNEGLSVAVVLHELNLASEYCERLILLDNGRINIIGTPKQVLDYCIIEKVYKTTVVVQDNPISGKPYILIVPEHDRRRKQ